MLLIICSRCNIQTTFSGDKTVITGKPLLNKLIWYIQFSFLASFINLFIKMPHVKLFVMYHLISLIQAVYMGES